jgi:hypothetical protein
VATLNTGVNNFFQCCQKHLKKLPKITIIFENNSQGRRQWQEKWFYLNLDQSGNLQTLRRNYFF